MPEEETEGVSGLHVHNPAIRAAIIQAAYNMQTDARVSHAVHKSDKVIYKNVDNYHKSTTIFINQQWFRPHGLLHEAHHRLCVCQGHFYFPSNVCVSTIAIVRGPSVPDGEANSLGIVLLIIYTLHMSSCCVKTKYAHPSEPISIVRM